jgi:glucose-6-phosphate 1-epimerase
MFLSHVLHQNQPCLRLILPSQDTVLIALHGAQILSWRTGDGRERLYMSPKAVMDGRAAIRGGVPVCFPQFNMRGPLPKHGFARNLAWQPVPSTPAEVGEASQTLQLRLCNSADTRPFTDTLWPHQFDALLTVRLAPQSLHMALQVRNTGQQTMPFTVALHTYLAVQHLQQLRLAGLTGLRYWDALTDTHPRLTGDWRYSGPFDAVFPAPPAPLVLHDEGLALEISQSPSMGQTVVWNPGPALSQQLADMPDDGYQHMLCVEAAQIDTPVELAAGAQWLGWQQLRAL